MNEFESTLVAALRAESEEIAMDVDLHTAGTELDERLDHADHRRRRAAVLGGLAAAAAVVLALVGVRVVTGVHQAQPVDPSPAPSVHQDPYFTPPFSLVLPAWVVAKHVQPHEDAAYSWWPSCDQSSTCTDFSVSRYDSLRVGSATSDLTAEQYLAHLVSLQQQGILTIHASSSSTVDGRAATDLGITTGKVPQELVLGCASNSCQDVFADMLMRVVVVDMGPGQNPVVIYTETARTNPDAQAWLQQMDTPLSTIRLTG